MTINSKPCELTVQEHEMVTCLTSQFDYITKKDAIRFFISTYGKTRTIGQMVRAYNSIVWHETEKA